MALGYTEPFRGSPPTRGPLREAGSGPASAQDSLTPLQDTKPQGPQCGVEPQRSLFQCSTYTPLPSALRWEGPYVDGNPHGQWVLREADGAVREVTYVNGERQF